MEEEYLSGKYSVEESNIRQFALVGASQREIEDFVLGEIVIRYAFDEFVDYCSGEGIRLVIVSSGLDMYIKPPMEQFGFSHLEVHSGKAAFTDDGIVVEYEDPYGSPITSGFKDSFVSYFKKQGTTIVYVGDGLSDIAPATEADFVIARSTLADHLENSRIPHFKFDTFSDVGIHVEEIRGRLDK